MLNKSIRKTKSNNPTASETSTRCLNELHCCQIIQINVFCFGVFKDLLIIIQVNCQWSIAEFPQFPTYFQHLKPIMIFATNVIKVNPLNRHHTPTIFYLQGIMFPSILLQLPRRLDEWKEVNSQIGTFQWTLTNYLSTRRKSFSKHVTHSAEAVKSTIINMSSRDKVKSQQEQVGVYMVNLQSANKCYLCS